MLVPRVYSVHHRWAHNQPVSLLGRACFSLDHSLVFFNFSSLWVHEQLGFCDWARCSEWVWHYFNFLHLCRNTISEFFQISAGKIMFLWATNSIGNSNIAFSKCMKLCMYFLIQYSPLKTYEVRNILLQIID
jgi:hypothetical protein